MTEPSDSKLTAAISRLLTWCLLNRGPDHKRKHEFGHGLSITLYVDGGYRRHVLLARKGTTGPSAQEARTVLAHWPERVPAAVEWIPSQKAQFACLIAIWDPPQPVKQMALGESLEEQHGEN